MKQLETTEFVSTHSCTSSRILGRIVLLQCAVWHSVSWTCQDGLFYAKNRSLDIHSPLSTQTHTHTHTYTHTHTHTHKHTHTHTHSHTYMYTRTHTLTHTYTHTHIHTLTHTHRDSQTYIFCLFICLFVVVVVFKWLPFSRTGAFFPSGYFIVPPAYPLPPKKIGCRWVKMSHPL